MRKIYIIDGVRREGDEVKLVLNAENIVREKPSLLNMMNNIGQVQEQMTFQTKKIQDPDQLRIPHEVWCIKKWNIGDRITIDIDEEEVV